MRIRAEQHFVPELDCHPAQVEVKLDGVILNACVALDTVEGWADCYARSADGKFKMVGDPCDPEIAIERRFGVVEATRRPQ